VDRVVGDDALGALVGDDVVALVVFVVERSDDVEMDVVGIDVFTRVPLFVTGVFVATVDGKESTMH